MAWAHHHPKPEEPAPAVRDVPVAQGTLHEPAGGEYAAPHHTGDVVRRLQVFAPIIWLIGISVIQFVGASHKLRVHSDTFPAKSRQPDGDAPVGKQPTAFVVKSPLLK